MQREPLTRDWAISCVQRIERLRQHKTGYSRWTPYRRTEADWLRDGTGEFLLDKAGVTAMPNGDAPLQALIRYVVDGDDTVLDEVKRQMRAQLPAEDRTVFDDSCGACARPAHDRAPASVGRLVKPGTIKAEDLLTLRADVKAIGDLYDDERDIPSDRQYYDKDVLLPSAKAAADRVADLDDAYYASIGTTADAATMLDRGMATLDFSHRLVRNRAGYQREILQDNEAVLHGVDDVAADALTLPSAVQYVAFALYNKSEASWDPHLADVYSKACSVAERRLDRALTALDTGAAEQPGAWCAGCNSQPAMVATSVLRDFARSRQYLNDPSWVRDRPLYVRLSEDCAEHARRMDEVLDRHPGFSVRSYLDMPERFVPRPKRGLADDVVGESVAGADVECEF